MRLACLTLALALAALAQPKFEYWPGAAYDPSIPTARKVLGYEIGEQISSPANIVRYLNALAAAQPARMKIFEYGRSWEGRELVYAVIGSEANMRRLAEIRDGMARLHDPRKTPAADARKLIATLPAILWLAYGVHGNEISSSDAALLTAYHLLAARNDKTIAGVFANAVVVICPLQNPDGRNRFVHDFEINEGPEPDPNPLAAEHTESWPGGRTNHYYFDLNRDWIGITQPETIGHVKALQEWYPQVFIDLHEMGTDSTYYFTPESDPYNPYLTKEQHDNLYWFGKNNAKYFDQFGFRYFTRENYDAFYPGYGASWPFYYGGLAMTYENGSTRGLAVRRSDDTVITFRETVRRHFVTSISSCEVVAANREKLLDMFYRYQTTALEDAAKDPIKEYILPRRGNTSAVDRLAQLLVSQGVEVARSGDAFSSDGKNYPTGSYVISLAQPERRLVRDLLDPQVSMDEAFLKSEEHRRQRRQRTEIYDVTAWSLPLQFNVEAVAANARSSGNFTPVKPGDLPPGSVSGKASVAYLVPWGSTAAARLMTAALRENLRVLSADRPFTRNGRKFSAGTLIILVKENGPSVHETMQKLARNSGAEVVAADSSWVEEGPDFGSARVVYLRRPAILLAWDRPTSAASAGQARWLLERQFGYPVTVIRTDQFAAADLARFQVIILPEAGGRGGGYDAYFEAGDARRLREWVRAGGTLIGIGSAVSFMSANSMLAIQRENAPSSGAQTPAGRGGRGAAPPTSQGRGGASESAGAATERPGTFYATETDLQKAIQPENQAPWPAHGFLAKAKVDQEDWITAGVPESVYVLVSGSAIYSPIKADKGSNSAVFAGPESVLASGYSWEEFRKQLAFKPFLITQRDGRGNEIGFTADPNYRGYMDGLNLLFLNAVFRGPAHAGGGRTEE